MAAYALTGALLVRGSGFPNPDFPIIHQHSGACLDVGQPSPVIVGQPVDFSVKPLPVCHRRRWVIWMKILRIGNQPVEVVEHCLPKRLSFFRAEFGLGFFSFNGNINGIFRARVSSGS